MLVGKCTVWDLPSRTGELWYRTKDFRVLDNDRSRFESGHIQSAKHVNLGTLQEQSSSLDDHLRKVRRITTTRSVLRSSRTQIVGHDNVIACAGGRRHHQK